MAVALPLGIAGGVTCQVAGALDIGIGRHRHLRRDLVAIRPAEAVIVDADHLHPWCVGVGVEDRDREIGPEPVASTPSARIGQRRDDGIAAVGHGGFRDIGCPRLRALEEGTTRTRRCSPCRSSPCRSGLTGSVSAAAVTGQADGASCREDAAKRRDFHRHRLIAVPSARDGEASHWGRWAEDGSHPTPEAN